MGLIHLVVAFFRRPVMAFRLKGKAYEYKLGAKVSPDTCGYPNKYEQLGTVNLSRRLNGYANIRILYNMPKENESFSISFNPNMMISGIGIGIEFWYEHTLDMYLGPGWHSTTWTDPAIFKAFTEDVLLKCVETLDSIFMNEEEMQGVDQLAREFYFERTLKVLKYLLSSAGKTLKEKHGDTVWSYEDKKKTLSAKRILSSV